MSALFGWTILTPSHFQKGGVDNDFYFIIALFVNFISLLISLSFDNFHWIERVVVSFPFAFISLFVTTVIVGPKIVEYFYYDKTWFLWETKHRLFINSIFYGLNATILTLLSFAYFNIRGQLKSHNHKKITETIG